MRQTETVKYASLYYVYPVCLVGIKFATASSQNTIHNSNCEFTGNGIARQIVIWLTLYSELTCIYYKGTFIYITAQVYNLFVRECTSLFIHKPNWTVTRNNKLINELVIFHAHIIHTFRHKYYQSFFPSSICTRMLIPSCNILTLAETGIITTL